MNHFIIEPLVVNVSWKLKKRSGQHSNSCTVRFRCPKCKRIHRVRELYVGAPSFQLPSYFRNRCGQFTVAMPWAPVDLVRSQLHRDGVPAKVLIAETAAA